MQNFTTSVHAVDSRYLIVRECCTKVEVHKRSLCSQKC